MEPQDTTVEQYVESLFLAGQANPAEIQAFAAELYKYFGKNVMLSDIPEGYTQDGAKSALTASEFVIPFMKKLKPFYDKKANGT